jgi:hypothetical protein
MDSKSFHSTNLLWDTDIDFSIESTESSKSWIKRVWSVGSTATNNSSSGFDTAHEFQKLSNDSSFDLTISPLSVWSNGINLIYEDNSWSIGISFSESLSQVPFSSTRSLHLFIWNQTTQLLLNFSRSSSLKILSSSILA